MAIQLSLFPKETQMAVNVGMNLKAGSSLLGYFPA